MYIPEYNNKPKIIIFSGAGLSAESGIQTFRDSDGLWENYSIEDVCNEYTWKKNFDLVHEFYNARRKQLATVHPNEAHQTIKRLYDNFGDDLLIITQNVDDMLERTGIPKDKILHLHGFLTEMQCESCGNVWDIGNNEFNIGSDRCPKCNSLRGVKPNIVFFNGQAPMYRYLYRAVEYMNHKDSKLIIVGTMGNVVQIDNLTKQIPSYKKILNNLEPSPYINSNNYSYVFYEPATVALPKIEKLLESWSS